MERKIGEVFKAEDGALLVVEARPDCDGCYYYNNDECTDYYCLTEGHCCSAFRKDGISVIFAIKNTK